MDFWRVSWGILSGVIYRVSEGFLVDFINGYLRILWRVIDDVLGGGSSVLQMCEEVCC